MNISKAVVYSLFLPITTSFTQHTPIQLSTTVSNTDLDRCQEKICEQWNEFLHTESYENIPKIKNWLDTHSFRCNSSDPIYKPYHSLNKCRKNLCRSAKMIGKSLKECLIDTDKLTSLWNRFCSKVDFDPSNGIDKAEFFYNCFTKICAYRSEDKSSDYNFLCMSLDLKSSVKKLSQIFQDWLVEMKDIREKQNQTESFSNFPASILVQEKALGITSSVFSIVSSIAGFIGVGMGLYVAKITVSNIATTLPHISSGLRNMVDGTLAYSRWASTLTSNFLTANSPQSTLSVRQISQVSSQIASIYQSAMDSQPLSLGKDDFTDNFREITFNFNEEVENTIPELNSVIEETENDNVDSNISHEETENDNVDSNISHEETENDNVDSNISHEETENDNVDSNISHEVGINSAVNSAVELDNFNEDTENATLEPNNLGEQQKNINLKSQFFPYNIFPTRGSKTFWEVFFEAYVKD